MEVAALGTGPSSNGCLPTRDGLDEHLKKDLPYFKWYPADALSDIDYASMDVSEVGLFHMCLNYAWLNDGLPNDPVAIAKLLRLDRRHFLRLWPKVSRKFPEVLGRLRNQRQEQERDIAKNKSASATESAKARYERSTKISSDAAPRALARTESVSVSDALFSQGGAGGELELVANKENLADSQDRWFDDWFWPVRWRNDGKKAALGSWRRRATSEEKAKQIVQSASDQKPQYLRRDTDKRPYMSTWLNQERFEDESEVFEEGATGRRTLVLSKVERRQCTAEEIAESERLAREAMEAQA